MKVQLNLRNGSKKAGFRILRRFPNMKVAREYLLDFIKSNTAYRPTEDPDVFYDNETHTQVWLSKQFAPTGNYRYRNPNR